MINSRMVLISNNGANSIIITWSLCILTFSDKTYKLSLSDARKVLMLFYYGFEGVQSKNCLCSCFGVAYTSDKWIGNFWCNVLTFNISESFQRDEREFVLNRLAQCSGNHPVLAKVTFNSTSLEKNIFSIQAVVVMNENLGNDLSMRLQYKRCKLDKSECFGRLEFPVPSLCALLATKTSFSDGLGNSFSPKMVCPIKKGTYNADIALDLKTIVTIPLERILYDLTLSFFDVTKHKEITCMNLLMWVKHI